MRKIKNKKEEMGENRKIKKPLELSRVEENRQKINPIGINKGMFMLKAFKNLVFKK